MVASLKAPGDFNILCRISLVLEDRIKILRCNGGFDENNHLSDLSFVGFSPPSNSLLITEGAGCEDA